MNPDRTCTRMVASPLVLMALCAGSSLQAQNAVISGRVTSEAGAPVELAQAAIPELEITVGADADGRFTLVIPAGRVQGQSATLRVRSIGYMHQARTVGITPGVQTHDFVLRRDINRLEEVVVTGALTGTAQNKLAFSVARLDESDMPVPGANALQQLQGKIPGAHIVQPTGQPGAGPAVVLRGPKSLNATGRAQGPLIIVDGVILDNGLIPGRPVGPRSELQEINPLDIESIEVVKGAAASSLYGSRAGAGVIQVTTKSGRRGSQGTRFSVRSEYGFKDVQEEYPYSTRHFLMMDEHNERFCIRVAGQPACSRTVDFEEEARRINDIPRPGALQPHAFERDYGITGAPSRPELKGLFQVNQWPKRYNPIAQIVTNGELVNNTVEVSTRAGGTGYFASVSNLVEEGAMRYLRGYRRSSARVNVDQAVSDALQLELNSTFATSTQFAASSGGFGVVENDDFFRVTRVPPSVNLLRRDTEGRLYIRSNPLLHGAQNNNPLYDFENHEGQLDVDRAIASLMARYRAFSWLSFDATVGMDRHRGRQNGFRDRGYRTTSFLLPDGSPGEILEESIGNLSHNIMFGGTATFGIGADWRGTFTSRYSYEQQDLEGTVTQGGSLTVPGVRTLANATTTPFKNSGQWSVRAMGAFVGTQLEFRERYIVDALLRYDGSSLFGGDERWHQYYRGSFAWRLSEEPFWRWSHALSDVKLRASVGTAGGRPNFSAQYETFSIAQGGQVIAGTRGNKRLKPEKTLETEYGVDAELFARYALSFTFARAITRDQLLLAPAPVASGYPSQWSNAGTLDGKTYELSLRLPLIDRRDFSWTSQLAWDRNRSYITALNVPPHFLNAGSWGVLFFYGPGERFGTIYGRRFITACSELPAPFSAECGPGQEWQANDEGYIVWVGSGRSWQEGVRDNLWQGTRPGCLTNGAPIDAIGELECANRGGTINNPWGAPEVHWGMPIVLRDSTGGPTLVPLGNTLPDYRASMSHSLQWKRVNVYGLLDASVGNRVLNMERNWSLGDFMVREQDQDGKTPEAGKPIGYYWRASRPVNSFGVGGFYDVGTLGNNRTVEDGSYVKLREVSITYHLGRLPAVSGDWSISAIGRNLYTWTRYTGWDPEVGRPGGTVNSAALAAGGTFQYPPTRAFTLALAARF